MTFYSVIGWSKDENANWATFDKDYKRRNKAEKVMNELADSGKYRCVMLRKKEVCIDDGSNYVSIDIPLRSLQCESCGKITSILHI